MTMYQPEVAVDGLPVMGSTIDDIDMTMVQRHIALAMERGRIGAEPDTIAFLLRNRAVVDVYGGVVPTVAGLLMFTPEPDRWLTASGVDVAQFRSGETHLTEMTYIERIRGALPSMIDRTTQMLWDRTEHDFVFDGVQRVEVHAYPMVVLRELTVNAIAHRRWDLSGSRVRINLHPASITWISPGELPEGIRIEDLLTIQHSRNPHLTQLLFQAGYIEGFGLGLDTVFAALREAKSPAPEIQNGPHTFNFTVYAAPIATNERTEERTEQRQQRVVTMIQQRGPLSISELEVAMSVHRRTLQRDLRDLVQAGVLRVEGATTNRRYVFVESEHL